MADTRGFYLGAPSKDWSCGLKDMMGGFDIFNNYGMYSEDKLTVLAVVLNQCS